MEHEAEREFNLRYSRIKEMLNMQDKLNCRLDPNWRNRRDFVWLRAVWIECAEAMDKIGWKWWKKQTPDEAQLQLELVDIWHFILSDAIVKGYKSDVLAWMMCGFDDGFDGKNDLLYLIEGISQNALGDNLDDVVQCFGSAMKLIGMSFDQLFESYAAKYTLNEFRWDNGYQDGSYRKVWADGREDNEHLVDIAAQWSGAAEFATQVYQGLSISYSQQGAVLS